MKLTLWLSIRKLQSLLAIREHRVLLPLLLFVDSPLLLFLYMTRCAKVLACHCTNTSLPVSSDNKEKLAAEKRLNDLCTDTPVMT